MARDQARGESGSLLTGRNIVGDIIIVILVAFLLQNREKTELTLLFWTITAGLWLLLAAAVVLAFVAGLLFGRSAGKSAATKK